MSTLFNTSSLWLTTVFAVLRCLWVFLFLFGVFWYIDAVKSLRNCLHKWCCQSTAATFMVERCIKTWFYFKQFVVISTVFTAVFECALILSRWNVMLIVLLHYNEWIMSKNIPILFHSTQTKFHKIPKICQLYTVAIVPIFSST